MNPTLRDETLMLCAIRHERTRTRRSVAYSANDAHDGGCSQFPGWAKGDVLLGTSTFVTEGFRRHSNRVLAAR